MKKGLVEISPQCRREFQRGPNEPWSLGGHGKLGKTLQNGTQRSSLLERYGDESRKNILGSIL